MRYYIVNNKGKLLTKIIDKNNTRVIDFILGKTHIFKGHTRMLVVIK